MIDLRDVDIKLQAFTRDCINVVEGRVYRAWPGVLVIAGVDNRMNIRWLEDDHPGHLWFILQGANFAAMAQPLLVDQLPALFLITAPKHPDPRVRHSTFSVRHLDGAWEAIPNYDTPWFGASTAGAMRNFMCTGKRTQVKYVADKRLFGRVLFDEPPPTDRHGRI